MERDDCDSRSCKSSETSGGVVALAEAYRRQNLPATAAVDRASRSAILLSEDGSSRKAIANAWKDVAQPKFS